jgi:O-antigen/teichoic acid export membrane protein
MSVSAFYPEGIARLARQAVLLGLRAGATAAKFALTLYMARFLGLADLGLYGLLVGAATAVPAIFGFGLNDWVTRNLVGLPLSEALARLGTRLSFTVALHVVLQPVAWTIDAALGAPVPTDLALPIGLILLLEHLSADVNGPLMARHRALLATVLFFVRNGAWPFVVIILGLLDPAARTLSVVLWGWVAGLTGMWIMLAVYLLPNERWRMMTPRLAWFRAAIGSSWPFYLSELGVVGNLYLDRFLISLFLGLEATGIYTFFWSLANVVHTLSVNGVMQPHIPKLVEAAARGGEAFRATKRNLQIETLIWATGLAGALSVALPLMLPLLGRPELQHNLGVFAIIAVATLMRMAADSLNFVLFALHRDRSIAAISLCGVALSALANSTLIPLLGLKGAACAYLMTGTFLLVLRHRRSRTP